MKVRWTHPALADFIEAQDFIARDDPQAATRTAERVWAATNQLALHPSIGRAGSIEGTRVWVVGRTPFLIIYRIRDDDIEILRIWHGRRNWQHEPAP